MTRAAKVWIACCWLACAAGAAAQRGGREGRPAASVPETNPFGSAADVEAGRRLYLGRCGHCHGQNGEGGRGAPLDTGRLRHGGSDREIFLTIRNGVPGTEMPPAYGVVDIDLWRMVGYLQQLGRRGAAPEAPSGDAAAGESVYRREGCARCHAIGGQGGYLGPDLTSIGVRRMPRHLRESVLDPSADIPNDYRTVVVKTRAGQTTSGIHLNEDEYSIHLRDTGGSLRSFLKSELEDLKLPRQSLMPPSTALQPADLENLIAYLASLRPRR